MSKTLSISKRNSTGTPESSSRSPVRGRNRNNHQMVSKPVSAEPTRGARPERGERSERADHGNRPNRPNRPEQGAHDAGARSDRGFSAPRAPRNGYADRGGRPAQGARPERGEWGERSERVEHGKRPNRPNRPESGARDAGARLDRPSRGEFSGEGQRFDRASKDASKGAFKGAAKGAGEGRFAHRESLARAPQRHGKVRDGVRTVVDGHVVRGEKRVSPQTERDQHRKALGLKVRDHSSEQKTNPSDGIRISKYLADKGMCSRREADQYIEKGWVTVNGVRVTLGQRILPTDKVQLARQATIAQESRVTIVINKPMGFVSGQAEDGYLPAASLVTPENQWDEAEFVQPFDYKHLRGLAPAGRLDIDSVGLLVLTQDGRVAKQLIGEDSDVDKEYLVRVEGQMIEGGLALLNHGLELDGVPLRPAQVSWQNEEQLMFVLREGKKRQIRRMCELVGLKVVGLKRVRIGQVTLGHLPTGKWRYLADDESF